MACGRGIAGNQNGPLSLQPLRSGNGKRRKNGQLLRPWIPQFSRIDILDVLDYDVSTDMTQHSPAPEEIDPRSTIGSY